MDTSVIDQIVEHARKISCGEHDKVRPGMPMRISEAAVPGEFVWQGDLKLTIVDRVPNGLSKVESFCQLVPGNTVGARHCLDSTDGVECHVPEGWGPKYEGLVGPCLVLQAERAIEHPKHGHVTIPAGMIIQCSYQRVWDVEQARERRSRD